MILIVIDTLADAAQAKEERGCWYASCQLWHLIVLCTFQLWWIQRIHSLGYINRIDHFLVPVQCMENSGCFPLGNASSHSTALPSFFSFLCSVFVFPYHQLWASFMPAGYGIFNVYTYLGERRTHEGVRHKQVCPRVDSEGQKNCRLTLPRRGIEPRVFGLEFRRSNHWPTWWVHPHVIPDFFIYIYMWSILTKGVSCIWGRYELCLQAKKWGTIPVSSAGLSYFKNQRTGTFLSFETQAFFLSFCVPP